MITLITYKAGFGELSYSPFCVKAIWLLRAAGVTWQRQDSNDPRKMPYAKLPAIVVGDQTIGDSHNIQRYLEQGGTDFWGPVSPLDRSIGRAFIRMAEEHLYFHILLDRWADPKVWPIVRESYFADIPAPLRRFIAGGIRRSTLRGLHIQGLGRFTPQERLDRLAVDLDAIRVTLSDAPFLLGDEPCLPDYSVAAMLVAAMASPLSTKLSRTIGDCPVLSAYAWRVSDRMTDT